MIEKTKHAHTNFKIVAPYVAAADGVDGSARFKADGFMDFVIENPHCRDCYGNPVYSAAHYGEQYGDLMRDPDVTFSVSMADERIIPLTFQNDYLGIYQEAIREIGGKSMYSRKLLISLDDFLWEWLKNIDMQGFSPAAMEKI